VGRILTKKMNERIALDVFNRQRPKKKDDVFLRKLRPSIASLSQIKHTQARIILVVTLLTSVTSYYRQLIPRIQHKHLCKSMTCPTSSCTIIII